MSINTKLLIHVSLYNVMSFFNLLVNKTIRTFCIFYRVNPRHDVLRMVGDNLKIDQRRNTLIRKNLVFYSGNEEGCKNN